MDISSSLPIVGLSATNEVKSCSYSRHPCSRPCYLTYNHCSQHLLEEVGSPFTSCEYISRTSKRKCPNPALRQRKSNCIPTYCDKHLHDLLAKDQHQKQKKKLKKRNKAEKRHPEVPFTKQRKILLDRLAKYGGDSVIESKARKEDGSDSDVEEVHRPITDDWLLENSDELRNNADWDDFDPVNNEVYEPLRYADVLTPEEVVATAQSKLIRLQSLYIEQFKRMFHLLKEKRRQYLHEKRREDRDLKSGKTPSEGSDLGVNEEDIRALTNYRKRSGVEALLRKSQKKRRLEASDGVSDYPVEQSAAQTRCAHMSNHARCRTHCLPYTKFCSEHILEDPHQLLYRKCNVESCPTAVCHLTARDYKLPPSGTDEDKEESEIFYCLIHAPLPEMTFKFDSKLLKKLKPIKIKKEPGLGSPVASISSGVPCASGNIEHTDNVTSCSSNDTKVAFETSNDLLAASQQEKDDPEAMEVEDVVHASVPANSVPGVCLDAPTHPTLSLPESDFPVSQAQVPKEEGVVRADVKMEVDESIEVASIRNLPSTSENVEEFDPSAASRELGLNEGKTGDVEGENISPGHIASNLSKPKVEEFDPSAASGELGLNEGKTGDVEGENISPGHIASEGEGNTPATDLTNITPSIVADDGICGEPTHTTHSVEVRPPDEREVDPVGNFVLDPVTGWLSPSENPEVDRESVPAAGDKQEVSADGTNSARRDGNNANNNSSIGDERTAMARSAITVGSQDDASALLSSRTPAFARQRSLSSLSERKPSSADEEMAVVSLLSLRSGHPSDDNSHSSSAELE